MVQKKETLIIILLISNLMLSSGLFYLVITQSAQISILKDNYAELEENFIVQQSQLKPISQNQGNISDYTSNTSKAYELIEDSVVEIRATIPSLFDQSTVEGSGFVYDSRGHIITNAHVVQGSEQIDITFPDGTISIASLVGIDVYSDLAVIKADVQKELLKPVVLGNSSLLNIGDPVLAVGNPYGLSGSLTSGIVSQLDRILPSEGGYLIVGVIQVDVAINPGNSGGPLVNYKGEVVGVNTAIVSRTGEFSGVGFAIPSNLVKREVSSLISKGSYKHPWLGISGMEITPEIKKAMNIENLKGVLVTSIIEGGPADKAGVLVGNEIIELDGYDVNINGDIIIGIDGYPVKMMNDILVYLEYFTFPGKEVTLTIMRQGEEKIIPLTLGERPLPD